MDPTCRDAGVEGDEALGKVRWDAVLQKRYRWLSKKRVTHAAPFTPHCLEVWNLGEDEPEPIVPDALVRFLEPIAEQSLRVCFDVSSAALTGKQFG